MSEQNKEIVVVIGPGSIGQAIARRVGSGRTLLLAAHSEEATTAAAEQLRGDGFEVATRPPTSPIRPRSRRWPPQPPGWARSPM